MKKRIYSFDVLKIIATVCIIFHHYQIYTNTIFNHGINFSGGQIEFGYLVELFFILSGYFMLGYVNEIQSGLTFKEFFIPKYLRFLIPRSLTVGIFALLCISYEKLYFQPFADRTPTIWNVFQAALGFTTGWGLTISKMNGVIWYISILLICYVLFYLCTWSSVKLHCSPYWEYVGMIIVAFVVSSHSYEGVILNNHFARGISSFFFGIILAKLVGEKELDYKITILALLGFIAMLYAITEWRYTYANDHLNYVYTFLLYPFLIIFMKSKYISLLFKSRIWGTISAISFEAYIWHFPLILLMLVIDKLLVLNINYESCVFPVIIAIFSFLIGIPCYYFVEVPSMNCLVKKCNEI